MYPEPCLECGGIERHSVSPLCHAVSRGASADRAHCGSVFPANAYFRCGLPVGHETWDHGFWMLAEDDVVPEHVTYRPEPWCRGSERPWLPTRAWLHSRARVALRHEVVEVWLV